MEGGGVSQKVLTVILIMGPIAKIVFKTLEERLFKAKTSKITDYCWSVKWETLFPPFLFSSVDLQGFLNWTITAAIGTQACSECPTVAVATVGHFGLVYLLEYHEDGKAATLTLNKL